MRFRVNTKVFNKHLIKDKHQEIGHIHLVEYFTKGSFPHIEFWLHEDYRNKGIMTKELKKYLKICKKYDMNRLVAIVKDDNLASKKLMEKYGFIPLRSFGDKTSYIVDLNFTPEFMGVIMKAMDIRLTSNKELGG